MIVWHATRRLTDGRIALLHDRDGVIIVGAPDDRLIDLIPLYGTWTLTTECSE